MLGQLNNLTIMIKQLLEIIIALRLENQARLERQVFWRKQKQEKFEELEKVREELEKSKQLLEQLKKGKRRKDVYS